MINRALIRLKVVQLIYAYYQNEGKTTEVALKELEYSLDKAYDLYRSLLYLMVELKRMAERREELRVARLQRSATGSTPKSNDGVLASNLFLTQLESNQSLAAWAERQEHTWGKDEVLMKKLYEALLSHEVFLAYVDRQDYSYEADREVVRKLYKTLICNNEDFDAVLEEQSLYWNDDKEIVDSFVLKTIKRFEPQNGAEQELLPQYDVKEDPNAIEGAGETLETDQEVMAEDQEFAHRLFLQTIERASELRQLISDNTKNWEFSRLAFMDVVIMQIALAEILTFESIPVQVSFNEYLDIAKIYSTPRSSSYINGVLDNIVRRLAEQGALLKPIPARKPRPQHQNPRGERKAPRDGQQRPRPTRPRYTKGDNENHNHES